MEAATVQELLRYMPVDLAGKSMSERAQMGKQVAALLEHPGFSDLVEVLGVHADGLQAARIYRKPNSEAAFYADLTGHLRGLREVELIARGVVEDGKDAEREQREAEERGT
jgi:hypothetical protein